MTSIVFWTSASTKTITATVGATLKRVFPTPPHRFVGVSTERYVPATDEIVLAMGAEAIGLLAKEGLVAKNRTADSLRGKVFQRSLEEGRYMVSIDPGIMDVDPSRNSDIAWDVQLIARLCRTGGLAPVLGQYQWVDDFSEIIARIKTTFETTGRPVPVTCDIETLRLSPFQRGARIIAIGFTDRAGYADLLYVPELRGDDHARTVHEQVSWLLNSPAIKLRGANFKFDLAWLKVKWRIDCSNFSMDTVLVGSLLDENRSNGLKNHVKTYVTDLGGYDDGMTQFDMENMNLVPKDKLLGYFGGDVDGTYRVSEAMLEDLTPYQNLTRFYVHILHPGSVAFQCMERQGIQVDTHRYNVLKSDLETEVSRLHKEGLSLLPARLRAKFADNLSLSRAAVLKEYFFTPMGLNLKPKITTAKTGEPSTAKSHLEMFFDTPEAKAMCAVLDELNGANKALSTYVIGFLNHLRMDGKFHPSYFLHKGGNDFGDDGGTITGRLSAKDPAIQTVPKKTKWADRIRECLVAGPGYRIVEADFSQGELRIAACLAHETNMLAAYKLGIDLHVKTGARLAGLTIEQLMELQETDSKLYDLYRGKAKPANFGIIYGISWQGYKAYAWNGHRVAITDQEAEAAVNDFFDLYPGLLDWHKTYKAMAHRDEFVVSPLGRVRHLPHIRSPIRSIQAKAERQAINSPDQATLSDMMVWATGVLNKSHPDYAPIAMIHDAGYWLVPEDRTDEACKNITQTMGNLPLKEVFGWDHELDFPADATVGADLGHMAKWKGGH